MDKDILRQYEDMKREYADTARRIRRIEERLGQYENLKVRDTVKGGEGGERRYVVEGVPYPDYRRSRKQLVKSRRRFERLERELGEKLDGVETYIDSVSDSRKRLILRYKYLDGLTWQEIAAKMGPGYSGDSIRMEITRFLDRQQ